MVINKNIIWGKLTLKMADLQQNLIAGRGKKGLQKKQKRFQECQNKIKTVRAKNNELQKQCDNQVEGDIRQTIKWQVSFLDTEIKDLKRCLQKLAQDFTDPGSKKRIRDLCNLSSKQMQRNKRIMSEFINRASLSPSLYKRQSAYNSYRRSRTQFQRDLPQARETNLHAVEQKQDSSYMLSNDQLSDLKAEQKMMAERNMLIKELEEKNNKINEIINDMGGLVGGQQKDMVDKVGENLQGVHQNLQDVNSNLEDAKKHQRKSKRKIILLVVVISVVVIILAGVVYILTK